MEQHSHEDVIGMIGFLHPLGMVDDAVSQSDYLRRLSPHLTRASTSRAALEGMGVQRDQDLTALSLFPYGLAWVDAGLRVSSMNEIARRLLALKDGIGITNHHLVAYAPKEQEALAQALRMATSPARKTGAWQAVRRQRSKLPILVSVLPAPTRQDQPGGQAPLALVLFQDPAHRTAPNAAQLREIFDLTVAESRLAEGLLADDTLQGYAEKNNISRNTARTHLVNLFAKTGTRRQAELMRTLLSVRPL